MKIVEKIVNKFKRSWRNLNPFFLFPTNKKIILFESTSDFCDNSKALYDEIVNEKLYENYKLIWFVKEPDYFRKLNLPNTYFYKYTDFKMSLKSIIIFWYFNAIAGTCFYTHKPLGLIYKKKQNRVFLTHGTPLKDSTGKFWNVEYNTHIISTSDFAAKMRCQTFGGGNEKVLKLGFPRNDILFNFSKKVRQVFKLNQYKKVVIWMPTFKHMDLPIDREDMLTKEKNDMSIFNDDFYQKLNELLEKENILLIIKYHPHQNMEYVNVKDSKNILNLTNKELVEKNIDVYELLSQADALITDFSSVYLDYMILDKPMAFEISDIEKYTNGVGFLVENPLEFMPGYMIKDFETFKTFITDLIENKDIYRQEREKICNLMHENKDNNSSKRIIQYFLERNE